MGIRAAVMVGPNEPIAQWTLDEPALAPGGVMLETVASEVCGTDVHLHAGRLAGVPYPIVPGHVSVGRIVSCAGVEKDALGAPVAVGDLVTFLDVHEICGQCYHCAVVKQPNRCPSRKVYGITYGASEGPFGGWAERIYLQPGVRILKLPDGLEADDVIGGGCGLFTGFAAVERSELAMGDVVVVQGAGPVGLCAAAFAHLRGAGRVILIGAPRERLELGSRFGADLVLDLEETEESERAARLLELTGGRGVDVAIEACGNPRALPEALGFLRDGGTYVVAGHYTDAGAVALNPHLHLNRKHVAVKGQWGTELHHLVRALSVVARHRHHLPLREIIGARYGLDKAEQALSDVAGLKVTKAVIVP